MTADQLVVDIPVSAPVGCRSIRATVARVRVPAFGHVFAGGRLYDKVEWQELIQTHHAALLRAASRWCRDRGLDQSCAEDICNTAWQRAMTHPLGANLEDPELWLKAIARNVMREMCRKHQATVSEAELEDVASQLGATPPHDESGEDLAIAIQRLEDRERRVVEIVILAGHSPRFAADELGCSQATVYRTLAKAYSAIGRHFGNG